MSEGLLSADAFVERLRSEGAQRYHNRHPFNLRMHAGELTKAELQRWVVNRFYYQTRIPIKDAIIVSKSEDPAFRRAWIRRIGDHDGTKEGEGGLAEWLVLARGLGLDEDEVRSCRGVLPAVRAACDQYVDLVRTRPLVEAVASSLTEHFAPDIMRTRVAAWEKPLSVGRRGGARVLPGAGPAGHARRRRGARVRGGARDDPGRRRKGACARSSKSAQSSGPCWTPSPSGRREAALLRAAFACGPTLATARPCCSRPSEACASARPPRRSSASATAPATSTPSSACSTIRYAAAHRRAASTGDVRTLLAEMRGRGLIEGGDSTPGRARTPSPVHALSRPSTRSADCREAPPPPRPPDGAPYTLVAELTHRCPLACPYCSNPRASSAGPRS